MNRWINEDRLLLELSDLMDEFSELDERGLHNDRWCGIMDSKQVIINAPGIELCEDAISRADAIEQIVNTPTTNQDKGQEFLEGSATRQNEIINILKTLPSVVPSRPQGKWIIEIDANGNTYGRCSICGMRQYAGQLNFCPDCGADMRGTDNEL